ncbi:hypothetical protein CFIMG_004568RA (mitochondrion) [Ceratocystis fimbriata CBS 114723]|uniref:Homing endonuclease LAGLIDADG domain-containing protein n=1 Tax=Ceratocystis fimbriata CBS 114723 TaxID=1035309 RepID=A0A2C5WU41_9PEZI|nr:hypothetical protein CFIMG_004568RA [Ceratocystis fimbriata CBS 114723]
MLFLVTQHIRDMELLNNLALYLNCGYAIPRSNSVNHYDYFATKKEDIKCKIIPFFEKYTLQVQFLEISEINWIKKNI